MSRPRFTSQQLFQQQVSRLQHQRTQLLRQRNLTQFNKRLSRNIPSHPTPSYRQSHDKDTDPDTRKNELEFRSSKGIRESRSPASMEVQQVKMMLEEVVRNGERYGMDRETSMRYLRNMGMKLEVEIRMVVGRGGRGEAVTKLKELKQIIDKMMMDISHGLRTTYPTSTEKSVRETKKQVNQKKLERIQEVTYKIHNHSRPKSENVQSSGQQSNDNVSSSVDSILKEYQRVHSDFRKKGPSVNYIQSRQITPRKSPQPQHPSHTPPTHILQSLQSRLLSQLSHLRTQNTRLHHNLTQNRSPPSSSTPRLLHEETIIHRLNYPFSKQQQYQKIQEENKQLKNRIRTLEMELLGLKSLRNIGIGSRQDIKGEEERLWQELEGKDREIQRLRREGEGLKIQLEERRRQIEELRGRTRNQSKMRYQIDPRQRYQNQNNKYFRTSYEEYLSARTKVEREQNENRRDGINRNNSNFENQEEKGREEDKIWEYRKLLNNLKSIKK